MLGRKTIRIKIDTYSCFYEFLDNSPPLANQTLVVDGKSRIYLVDSTNNDHVDVIFLNGAEGLVGDAEINRILNYKFEGYIYPAVEFLYVQINLIKDAALEILLKIKNTGKVPLYSIGSVADKPDRIQAYLISKGRAIHEFRLDNSYRVIRQDETVEYFALVDNIEIPKGELEVRLNLIKEGEAKEAKFTNKLNITLANEIKQTKLDIDRLISGDKVVSFTFDGKGSLPPSEAILEILHRTDIKATFFLTGECIEKYPEYIEKIIDGGHEIGNHTLTHPRLCHHLNSETNAGVEHSFLERELSFPSKLLKENHRTEFSPIWRAPFGAINDRIISWAYQLGYKHVFWTYDSNDWRIPDKNQHEWTEEVMITKLSEYIKNDISGSIFLFHTGVDYSHPTLKKGMVDAINYLKETGFNFVQITPEHK